MHSDEFHLSWTPSPASSACRRATTPRSTCSASGSATTWPRTQTVGLTQTISEQQALISERPGVFEAQLTSGGFGWVVVYLAGIDRDEPAELVYEAQLTAPAELVTELLFPW